MAVTSNTYTVGGSGQAGPYSYSFPILADADIKVSVNGIVKSVTTHYTLDSSNTRITFVSGQEPSTGDKVIVYRDTDEDPINATFVSGSTIRSKELNDNFSQLLYIVQENDNQALSTLGGVMQGNLGLGLKNNLYFEGDTDDAYETTVTVVDPTADRTITLPNETGTVVTTGSSGVVTSTMITDGTIVNADVNASAAIAQSKLNIANATTSAAGYQSAADKTKLDGIESGATADQTNAEIRAAVEAASDSNVFTDADHTKLNAIEAGATADQTNAEIRAAVEAATDSNVFTDADHTKLNAIEASATADQTSTEIKALLASDNLDASHLAANSVGTSEIADAELVTLAGMPGATASILASATALTSTTAELNLLDGKSIVTSVGGSSTDVQLPTAKAVNDQILALTQAQGGFYPIADELKFPNANPDPGDDAGTIVSIADAGGIVVNGSGVSTTGRTLGGSTVTINGIDSSLHNTTIAAGKGMLVQTTSTLNTYDYHRLVVDEAGVASAQTLVNDFNDRYQVAASAPSQHPDGSALADGDLWFDTSANVMKVYDLGNTSYAAVTSVGDYKLLTIVNDGQTSGSPTYNGSIVSYDLRDGSSAASITSVGQLLVSLNGVLQKPNSGSWSASNEGFHLEGTNGIKFCTAPPSGSSVFITLIGSATSVNVPATNSVVEAAIQSNVVSEEKLKISNTGTNNQFLQKQSGNSGGLTWADVPAGVGGATGVDFNDSVKARFGTGNDLEIFHNGSNSYIDDTGTGDLYIRGDNDLYITNADGSKTKARFASSGAVYLYYNNANKINTNSGGVTVQGTCTATSFAGDGSSLTGVDSSKADGCIWENDQTISNNYTIASGKGAHSVGPITVNATVTVNGNWVVS